MSTSRRRDETAKKIAAKMAKLQGVGAEGVVSSASVPVPASTSSQDPPTKVEGGVESEDRSGMDSHGGSGSPSEDPSGTHPAPPSTTEVEAGAVSIPNRDDQSDDSTAPASSSEDLEAPDEIVLLDEESIEALLSEDDALVEAIPELSDPAPLPVEKQGELVTIHFLEDGMSFDGRVWYRGEEITCREGDETYQKTVDRNGDSWLKLSDSDQIYKWDKIMFRPGPWPYQSMEKTLKEQGYLDASGDRKALKKKQREAAPPLPMSRG